MTVVRNLQRAGRLQSSTRFAGGVISARSGTKDGLLVIDTE